MFQPKLALTALTLEASAWSSLLLGSHSDRTLLLFLSAQHAGKVEGFPFGAVMLVVLSTSALTALAHRGEVAEPAAPAAAPGTTGVADPAPMASAPAPAAGATPPAA